MRGGAVRDPEARAALLVGLGVAYVALVGILRVFRVGVLLDPEPSWAPVRLALGIAAAGVAVAAGVAAVGVVAAFASTRLASKPPQPLSLTRRTLLLFAVAGLLCGAAARLTGLARLPESLWIDDVSLLDPVLELSGGLSDFADAIRPVPYGVEKIYGSVGVVYLEGWRLLLRAGEVDVLGVRLPSAIAGIASLVTAGLLGRSLLPRGGGTLTLLILAGLRWHLILSRWAWVMIALAAIADLAALALLRARRGGRFGWAVAAGLLAGLGTHIYLAGWVVAAALVVLALWPAEAGGWSAGIRRAATFGAAFALAVAPLFLFTRGRDASAFARIADHNVLVEIQHTGSTAPVFEAAADALAAPWLLADPSARHDAPGRRRLPLFLSVSVAIALLCALLSPRQELSGFLLAQAVVALAAAVAGGQASLPNGSRFAYLTGAAAVAAASGLMRGIALVPERSRRLAAIAVLGAVAISGALSLRDLVRWGESAATFEAFHGGDTRIGRAAARWASFGAIEVEPDLGHSDITIGSITRYRLDPDPVPAAASGRPRRFRVLAPAAAPAAPERRVEVVRDPSGREIAVVVGRAGP